ncbi:MAG: class I SAM-dependent methyltransferase [Planctomycetes bacterium]|nr:class I SAM-dependent methyltransferase [Planctomycetota bacterium]
MFEELEKINSRPEPFEFYTADDLWTDEYTSKQMLSYHLNEEVDISSRNTAFIEKSVEWIVSHFNIGAGTKIADFGCGPGLYTTRLAKRQADVTGIDFSKNSIRYAQEAASEEGLDIHYVNQNYLEYEADDRFSLVMMIMCDFCVLNPTQRKKMLSKFHKILQSGGSVLLDVNSLTDFEQQKEGAIYEANLLNGFWSPNKYYGFLNTFKYEQEKVVLHKYTLIEAKRVRTIYNWFQFFSLEALEKEFAECGFTVEGFYCDVAGSAFNPESAEFAIVARKP